MFYSVTFSVFFFNFIVNFARSNLSTSLRKSIYGSRIDDGFAAFIFNSVFLSCAVELIFQTFVIFMFL